MHSVVFVCMCRVSILFSFSCSSFWNLWAGNFIVVYISVIFVNENENGENKKITNSLTKTKTKTKNDEN